MKLLHDSYGVKQRCVLAKKPLKRRGRSERVKALKNLTEGIRIRFRIDGGAFNLARLKGHTRVTCDLITYIMCVDDMCFVADSPEGNQSLVESLHVICYRLGLNISFTKTVIYSVTTVAESSKLKLAT